MAGDDDIAAKLPEPPPPAPLRRQAAIEEAMRRFDAAHGAQPIAEPPLAPATNEPWWARIGRPQAAALVTAGLIALFGVPAAWLSVSHRSAPLSQGQLASADRGTAAPAAPRLSLEPSSDAAMAPALPTADVAPTSAAKPEQPAVAGGTLLASDETREIEAHSQPKPASASAAPMELARAEQADVLRADRVGRMAPAPLPAAPMVAPPPPPPPAMVASADASAPASANFMAGMSKQAAPGGNGGVTSGKVVTTQRRAARAKDGYAIADEPRQESMLASMPAAKRQRPGLPGPGDWNACTINDPGRSLQNCRRMIDPAAAGPNGRAAAHVADGLSRAWKGDLDGAIADFDRAIAVSPRNAIAYLNRGLALQRKGEFSRAGADLDRAVRYAPGAARGYYNRSLLLRQRGEADRAEADADRAVALDPDYVAVVK